MEVKNRLNRSRELMVRIPGWSEKVHVTAPSVKEKIERENITFTGITPVERSEYFKITLKAKSETKIKLDFDMPVKIIRPFRKVKTHKNRFALSRGPLVYCLERGIDPVFNLSKNEGDVSSFKVSSSGDGTYKISLKDVTGKKYNLVPYYSWGTPDADGMRVWLKSEN
jgi:DUF1680 family protein